MSSTFPAKLSTTPERLNHLNFFQFGRAIGQFRISSPSSDSNQLPNNRGSVKRIHGVIQFVFGRFRTAESITFYFLYFLNHL